MSRRLNAAVPELSRTSTHFAPIKGVVLQDAVQDDFSQRKLHHSRSN